MDHDSWRLTFQVGCQFAFVEEGAEEVAETELREKESMKRRLEQAENRCREAEKEREHWKLEAQLGGLRLRLIVMSMVNGDDPCVWDQTTEAHNLWHIHEGGGGTRVVILRLEKAKEGDSGLGGKENSDLEEVDLDTCTILNYETECIDHRFWLQEKMN